MKKTLAGLAGIILLSILAGCGEEQTAGNEASENKEEELSIYTTVYPIQFFAEQIGGEEVQVTSILPPGTDPHTYEPTTKEMIKIAEADAFIYNGAGLEGYAETIADTVGSESVEILETAKGIDLKEHLHEHGEAHQSDHKEEEPTESKESHEGHHHGNQDPHIWLDPLRSIQMAENIKELLIKLKPEKEAVFTENFNRLRDKLEELDQTFHEELEGTQKDEIIVSHAAYGYWEEAYGIEQIAVSGLSPTNVPSQKELEEIIQTAQEHDINYVLFEQNITPKVAEVIQKEIGAKPLRLHNLSVLTDENIRQGENYFTLMKHNLEQLKTALNN